MRRQSGGGLLLGRGLTHGRMARMRRALWMELLLQERRLVWWWRLMLLCLLCLLLLLLVLLMWKAHVHVVDVG